MYSPAFIKQVIHRYIDEHKGTVSSGEFRAPCPVHGDTNPSFSINLATGLYKCFAAQCAFNKGGNLVTFVATLDKTSFEDAKLKLDTEYGVERPTKKARTLKDFPITQQDVKDRCEYLLSNADLLKYVKENFLWTEETLRKYEIGFDAETNRYWIPVKENGVLLNVRRYSPTRTPKILSISGFGEIHLFPFENLSGDEIYIMEGEKDCLLANQLGLNAVTVTGGAGSFKSEWKAHFTNKNVRICYDIDEAGKEGATKVARNLIYAARNLKVIALPITEPKNGDFTDYIKAKNTIQDFLRLVDNTPIVDLGVSDFPVTISDDVIDAPLDKIDEMKLFYKRTRTNVRVIGTESSPFIIPRCMHVTCNKDNGKQCFSCRVGDHGGKDSVLIDEKTPQILDLIECGTRDKAAIIKDIFNIPPCRKYTYKEEGHQFISRVSIIPSIDDIQYDNETYNQTYVERELYYIGKSLTANTDYEIETITIPSSKDQSLVHLGYKVKFSDTSIEEFQMTPELHSALEVFKCK